MSAFGQIFLTSLVLFHLFFGIMQHGLELHLAVAEAFQSFFVLQRGKLKQMIPQQYRWECCLQCTVCQTQTCTEWRMWTNVVFQQRQVCTHLCCMHAYCSTVTETNKECCHSRMKIFDIFIDVQNHLWGEKGRFLPLTRICTKKIYYLQFLRALFMP